MVKKQGMAAALLLVLLTSALGAGCGGGGEPEEKLTKAEYVRKGNAICGTWQQARGVLFGKFTHEVKPPVTQAKREKAILAILKPYETAAEELGELSPPAGEEEKVEAIIAAMKETVSKGKADPAAILSGTTSFEKPNELAEGYGLKECKA
jgi:hypothetical protein